MQVSKLGNDLAVVLPKSVVESYGLREGDDVEVEIRSSGATPLPEADCGTREEALQRLREARRSLADEPASERHQRRDAALKVFDELSRPLPEGFRFDREEANAR